MNSIWVSRISSHNETPHLTQQLNTFKEQRKQLLDKLKQCTSLGEIIQHLWYIMILERKHVRTETSRHISSIRFYYYPLYNASEKKLLISLEKIPQWTFAQEISHAIKTHWDTIRWINTRSKAMNIFIGPMREAYYDFRVFIDSLNKKASQQNIHPQIFEKQIESLNLLKGAIWNTAYLKYKNIISSHFTSLFSNFL